MIKFNTIKSNCVLLAVLCALIVMPSCGGSTSSNTESDSGNSKNSSNSSQSDIIKRADGSVIKKGGYKASAPSKDAQKFKATIDVSKLPSKVDLRPYMSPVEDQGLIGSCTANATAGAYEYLMWWHKQTVFDISRLFLYYNSRAIENAEELDNGAMITDVMQSLHDQGVCSENSWPYIENKFTQRPPQNCYEEAKQYTISKYEFVDLDLNTWKSVLAEGYPIIFGVNTYDAFDNPRNGFISMPRNTSGDPGPHAMCCVGYSDPDRVFIVRNSWGHQWGDGGYCYIPYDYMMSPELNGGDCWVIYSTDANVDINKIEEDAWNDDDKSLFVDMENEFTNMSDENWYAMCEELGDYDIVYRLGAFYDFACWSDDDEEITPEETALAIQKLKKLLVMFGLDYSPKKVLNHCQKLSLNDENFLVETADILSKYLSDGARATIAADLLEICEADGEVSDGEREIILDLVGDWLNDDLIDAYYSDYYDEEEGDEYDYYDDEEDYDYSDEEYDDYDI
jgi:C1A family cysteine protease